MATSPCSLYIHALLVIFVYIPYGIKLGRTFVMLFSIQLGGVCYWQ